MAEIAGIAGISRSALADSPFWSRICADLDALGPRGAPFLRVVRQLGERHGAAVLAFGSWHGDWTRTNVAPHGHSVLAWDWERFGTGVPVGFDALHYDLLSSVTVGRRSPDQVVAGPSPTPTTCSRRSVPTSAPPAPAASAASWAR